MAAAADPRREHPCRADWKENKRDQGLQGLAEPSDGLLSCCKLVRGLVWHPWSWLSLPFPCTPPSEQSFLRALDRPKLTRLEVSVWIPKRKTRRKSDQDQALEKGLLHHPYGCCATQFVRCLEPLVLVAVSLPGKGCCSAVLTAAGRLSKTRVETKG